MSTDLFPARAKFVNNDGTLTPEAMRSLRPVQEGINVGIVSLSTGVSSLSTGLSTTNSSLVSLSTSTSAGLSTATSSIVSLSTSTSTGLSTVTSSVVSLSSSASTGIGSLSTGLSTTNSGLVSLSTSTSTGLSTHTSQITSLSTGLSTTNSGLVSLSTSASTGIGSLSTGLSTHTSQITSLSTGLSTTNSNVTALSTSASTGITSLSTGVSTTNSSVVSLSTSASTGIAGKQPLDSTLTALAAANWAANALPIGTGADALSQTSFAANTFPARASSGNLVAKTITDAALTVLDDATTSDMLTTLGAQAVDADLTSWAAITRAAGFDTFATTPTSANLGALLTDELGSGAVPFSSASTSWTPGLTFGGAATGWTIAGSGTYYRVGNIVFFFGAATVSVKGSATGICKITGLPVTSAHSSALRAPVSIHLNAITAGSGDTHIAAYVEGGATTIRPDRFVTGAGTVTQLADTDFTATSVVSVSGFYFV